MKYTGFFLLFLLLLSACGTDDFSNTRAYAEGKIISENIPADEVEIMLISQGRTVAQTVPVSSGTFVLSGPLFSDDFKIKFSRKIRSFSASKSGCTLTADSLSIEVPAKVSYISFPEIKVK